MPALAWLTLAGCGRIAFSDRGDGGSTDSLLADESDAVDAVDVDAYVAVPLVADEFSRTLSNDWGSAPIGGAWQVYNPTSATIGVNGSAGTIDITTAGGYADVHVDNASALDVETRMIVSFSSVPTTGLCRVSAVARLVGNSTAYDLEIELHPDATVQAFLSYEPGPGMGRVQLTTTVTAGSSYTPGDRIGLVLRATGTNPTTLCGRVWRVAASEPMNCPLSAQDSTAILQAAGDAYAAMDLEAGAPAPVTFSYDAFVYSRIGPL